MAGDLFSTLQDSRNPSIKRCIGIANCVAELELVERCPETRLAFSTSLVELRVQNKEPSSCLLNLQSRHPD